MRLDYYINLYELIESKSIGKEENRAFGLENIELKNRPIKALKSWIDRYSNRLNRPTMNEKFHTYMEKINLLSSILGFIFGIFTGIALLSYSGDEPVNVIYFMAMTILFPIFTISLSIFTMFKIKSKHTLLMEIVPYFIKDKVPNINISPIVRNWLIIKRTQMISLFFSIGIFLSFISIIATQDIAFSWSSTLHIDPKSFYNFLHTISFLWRDIFPSAVPSLELINSSHYYRLGDNSLNNVDILGDWWQFLALSTLFYAIFLRIIVLIISHFGLNKAIEKSTFNLGKPILMEMYEPLISTTSENKEREFISIDNQYGRIEEDLYDKYSSIQGWSFERDEITVMSDSLNKKSKNYFSVGGANSFDDDERVLEKSSGEIVLFVKSWEPPMMEFIDYLEDLSNKADKIIVYPVGLVEDGYKAKDRDIGIWENKLSLYDDTKVWFKK